jgi:hypothetical protein
MMTSASSTGMHPGFRRAASMTGSRSHQAPFAFIKADLATNANKYEREARASGFEVTEDDEPKADS